MRRALLYKSPSEKEASVSYQVTLDGIRDVDIDPHHGDGDGGNGGVGQATERGTKRPAENDAAHDAERRRF